VTCKINLRHQAANAIYAFGIFAGYVLLYRLNDILVGNTAFGGVASILFLPAFMRLLGFLIIGPLTFLPLFFAALICVDLGLGAVEQIIVALALASGSQIALVFANRTSGLQPSLVNLTAGRLLLLSFASAVGSSAAYNGALILVGYANASVYTTAIALVGDALGTWAAIYALKTLLTIVGRLILRSS